MKKFFVLGLCVAIAAGFTACNDDTDPSFAGDVRIISKVFEVEGGGEENSTIVKYGLEFVILGNKNLEKVTVTATGSTSYTMETAYNSAYLLQDDKDFVASTSGLQGTYTFAITMEGGEIYAGTVTDALKETSAIVPATITESGFDATDKKINIQWDKIDSADRYQIDMWYKNEENKDVQVYATVGGTYSGFGDGDWDIKSGSSGTNSWTWASGHPKDNTSYTVRVIGYKLDAIGNFDGVSIATRTVIWAPTE